MPRRSARSRRTRTRRVRLADLSERGAIPPEVQANLLDTEGTVFPSLAQLNAATALITGKWNAVVGVDIK